MAAPKPRPSAYQWLWAEIARRFGEEVAEDLKAGYLAQNKIYSQMKWHEPESPWQPRAKTPKKTPKKTR
jgi:hypothetical protein